MKTIKTVSGMTYAVTTTVDCTVTTPEGVLIATCRAGEQTLFVAPAAAVLLSDEGAVVTASFNGASAGSASGGGVSEKKVAEMIASSEGGVNVLYDSVTQSPAEGHLDNYDAYGWAMVVTEPGRLDTVTLQPRSEGTVQDPFPVYLNIWAHDGNAWKLLGSSENGVEQSLGKASVWTFSGVELTAGQKLHVEAHRQKGSEERDARLSVRVVANSLADTGMIERNGEVRVVDWVPQYTLALSRPAGLVARGVPLAEDADLAAHAQDAVRHITAAERASWNNKAEASALSGKVNAATFNAHTGDAVKHVTAAERAAWNATGELLKESDTAIRLPRTIEFYSKDYSRGVTIDAGGVQCWQVSPSDGFGIPWDALIVHPSDDVKHITDVERAAWNAKVDTEALAKKVDVTALDEHANSRDLHILPLLDSCCFSFYRSGGPSSTAGVFAGMNTSWLSARSDAVTLEANDDGFRFKINDSGAITELRLGEVELQALAALIAKKTELLALLQQPTKEI